MSTNSKEIPVLTGTAIPLGALKTKSSCGVGEFPDLVPFADFCKKAGLGLIQLLPVNDTGTESSPYSALSAFALHPIYISIEGLPEFDSVPDAKKALKDLHKKHDSQLRYNYRQLRSDKLKVLRLLFDSNVNSFVKDAESKNSEVSKWISENPWVTEYAVFMELKRQYKEASWKEWPEKYKRITKKQI
ncbi:MAG: 4-alpha-glucanotransferase, partial [Spirochaetaceae bacterium]|nr:4-alpha-glucanotransferase [Spirochaetaceae bacterium]